MSYADRIGKYPQIEGRCFACGGQTLFVGEGGYITCSYLSCPNPSAVNQVLLNKLPAGEEWCACCGLRFAVTEGECDQCWQTANDAKWTTRGDQAFAALSELTAYCNEPAVFDAAFRFGPIRGLEVLAEAQNACSADTQNSAS